VSRQALDDVGSMNTYRKYIRAHRIFANAKIVNQENVAPLRHLEQPVVRRSQRQVSRRLFDSVSKLSFSLVFNKI